MRQGSQGCWDSKLERLHLEGILLFLEPKALLTRLLWDIWSASCVAIR